MTNASAASAPANVADLVRSAARSTPDEAALIGPWGACTWAQLDSAIDVGVAALGSASAVTVDADGASAGTAGAAAHGQRVVLALPTGPELAAALCAVLRAGMVAVPVDPAYSDLGWIANRVAATIIITDSDAGSAGARLPPDLRVLSAAEVATWWDAIPPSSGRVSHDDVSADPPPPAAGGEDLAMLARCARPGPPVMLSHRALLAASAAVAGATPVALRPADRIAQVLPLHHVVGLVTAFLPAAIAGAAIVIPDLAGPATRVEAALAAVREHRVSVFPAEPTLYRQCERIAGFERALATVRLMTSGSSPLDPADFAAVRTATGQAVREGYGISEAASAVTSTLIAPAARPGSVGLPYPGVEVRILEASGDTGNWADSLGDGSGDGAGDGTADGGGDGPVDDHRHSPGDSTDLPEISDSEGEVGRIAIRGDTLFSGYWPDGSNGPGPDGWFVTGDIGYLDDADELHLVDRAEETITVAGFTVYPREVEDAIVQHPLVADAAVVGVPWSDGAVVVAAIVPKPGTRPTADDVEVFVADALAPFKRPTDYQVCDVLPRTEVGRLDRAAVRRDYAESRGIDLAHVADRGPDARRSKKEVPEKAVPEGKIPASKVPAGHRPGDRIRAGETRGEETSRDDAPGVEASGVEISERAADLDDLGRDLPAQGSRRLRSAQDSDDDLF